MHALLKFHRGVMHMPLPWRLWMALLVTANLVVPLAFVARSEAQLTLLALIGSVLLFTWLTAKFGFTRLLGLGHAPWIPLLWFLLTRLDEVPADAFYGIWLRAVIALNTVSLVIDAVDVVRYAAGDRRETVEMA